LSLWPLLCVLLDCRILAGAVFFFAGAFLAFSALAGFAFSARFDALK
jgi:hypothetical protein